MKERSITEEEAKEAYEKGIKEANELLKDPDKLEIFLEKLEKKLKVIPYVGESFSIVPAMISLVRSYIKKEYTEIPLGAVAGIISALIYIFSPVDLIPDLIPGVGYLDDASVLLICLNAGAKDDIKDYQKWREKNKKSIYKKVLVSYFSASGVTKRKAEHIAKEVEGDLYEIKPKEIYTDDDLNWHNSESRSSIEIKDETCRPAIKDIDIDIDNYDTIYVGFPIWWGIAPNVVKAFLDKIDLSNKKIIAFCTSGGSPLAPAIEDLKKTYPHANIN